MSEKSPMPAVAVLCFLVLGGCATELSPSASPVKIITAHQARCYQFVGTVEGTSSLTGLWENTGYNNALNEAMNKAAAAGASFLVIDKNRSVHRYWTTSEVVFGAAYKGPAKQGCSGATGKTQSPHAQVWK